MFDRIVSDLLSLYKPLEFDLNNENLGEHLSLIFTSQLFDRFSQLKKIDNKHVQTFYKNNKNVLTIEIQRMAIKITLNAKYGKLRDEYGLMRDVSNLGHWGSGDYQVKFDNPEKFNELFNLVEQIY